MKWGDSGFDLYGRHFLINIALPEVAQAGLVSVSRDPRKHRIKPACYVGTVEEVGPRCTMVKPGDRIVVERWTYQQYDVDEERLIAREDQVIVLANDTPAPNVMVLRLIQDNQVKSSLYIPDTHEPLKTPYYHGEIIATNAHPEYGEVGEEIFCEAYDYGQFHDGKGRLFFRTGKAAFVMLRLKREANPAIELAVI